MFLRESLLFILSKGEVLERSMWNKEEGDIY